MYVQKGGELFGFCPAKATWDVSTVNHFNMLVIMAETGVMPYAGGLYDQPAGIVAELSWFITKYDMMKFAGKADMILGGDPQKIQSALSASNRSSPLRGRQFRR